MFNKNPDKNKSSERNLDISQNFINQSVLVKELLDLTNIDASDLVLDIGAGKGIITSELLKRANFVIAIEQDKKLALHLEKLKSYENFQLFVKDFRDVELPNIPFKVFSNIPFDITTEIIGRLTAYPSNVEEIYLIMQEDAAKRFAGMPHHKNSQTSIILATEYRVEILRGISRNYFTPKPKVNIVFARFSKLDAPFVAPKDRLEFRDFVVYGFNQWAPTVLDALKKVFSHKQLLLINKSQKIKNLKPSDLSREQWGALFETYNYFVSEEKKALVRGSESKLKTQQKKLKKWNRSRVF